MKFPKVHGRCPLLSSRTSISPLQLCKDSYLLNSINKSESACIMKNKNWLYFPLQKITSEVSFVRRSEIQPFRQKIHFKWMQEPFKPFLAIVYAISSKGETVT